MAEAAAFRTRAHKQRDWESAAAVARITGRQSDHSSRLYRKPARENGFLTEGEITAIDDVPK